MSCSQEPLIHPVRSKPKPVQIPHTHLPQPIIFVVVSPGTPPHSLKLPSPLQVSIRRIREIRNSLVRAQGRREENFTKKIWVSDCEKMVVKWLRHVYFDGFLAVTQLSGLKPLLLALTYLQKILSNLCHLLDPTRGPEGWKQAHDKDNSALLVIILGSLVAVLSAALLILCVCFLSWRKKQRKGNLLSHLTYITWQPGAADICITVVFRERFMSIFSFC